MGSMATDDEPEVHLEGSSPANDADPAPGSSPTNDADDGWQTVKVKSRYRKPEPKAPEAPDATEGSSASETESDDSSEAGEWKSSNVKRSRLDTSIASYEVIYNDTPEPVDVWWQVLGSQPLFSTGYFTFFQSWTEPIFQF